MADTTLDNLTAATGTDLDDADLFLVLDGTNPPKKITRAELVKGLHGTGVAGDVLYHNGTTWVRLAKGTDGQTLTLASGAPSWATPVVPSGLLEAISQNVLSSTATSYTYTGLAAYDTLHIDYALDNPSTANNITFQVRVSGGTWRTIGEWTPPAGNHDSVYGQITVTNFARNYGVRTSASNQYYNSASALAGAAFGGNSSSEFRGSNGSTNADVGGNDEIRFTCVTAFGAFGGVDGEINIYGITV